MEQLLREGLKDMSQLERLRWKQRVEEFLKTQEKAK